ncbi:hypothetical protein CSB45_15445, partial [candidate division KSB3 bacterium]
MSFLELEENSKKEAECYSLPLFFYDVKKITAEDGSVASGRPCFSYVARRFWVMIRCCRACRHAAECTKIFCKSEEHGREGRGLKSCCQRLSLLLLCVKIKNIGVGMGHSSKKKANEKQSESTKKMAEEEVAAALPVVKQSEKAKESADKTSKKNDNQWVYLTGQEIYNFFSKVKNRFSGITVYALVGKSGTGKSFRARLLAEKIGVNYIIDDGLLIYGDVIVAGRSAKQAKGYLHAIRTALFTEDPHRDMVREAIREHKVKRLLLLGTSIKMVKRVAARLDLPEISEIIHIEEIASKADIEAAIKSRNEEGSHVIPVPAIEIKRDYAKILQDTIRIFFSGDKRAEEKSSRLFEKSIVQPEFAEDRRAGKVTISEAALSQMIFHCIDEFDSDIEVKKLKLKV